MSKELNKIMGMVCERERMYYNAAKVDALLAEKDKEIESLKASHYAEMVDANMDNRRLKRALWIARAKRAKERKNHFDSLDYLGISVVTINFESARTWMTCKTEEPSKWAIIFEKVERNCLKKAEEYK